MSFQQLVRPDQAWGIVGEIRRDGPTRANGYTIDPAATAANCVVGRVFTLDNTTNLVKPGGALSDTVKFAGILANPKVYASVGGATGPLSPTLNVLPGSDGEFVDMGFVAVLSTTVAADGNLLAYDNTTGVISAYANTGAIPGTSTAIPNGTVYATAQANVPGLVMARLTN